MPKKSKRKRSGRKYPRRKYWIQQRDAAFARAGKFCEVSGEWLLITAPPLSPKEVWRRACDHIIPERAVRRYCKGADPHILENLKVITPSLHSQKTAIEYLIFRWDIVGYKAALNRLGFNPLLFDEAWSALCASVKKELRVCRKHPRPVHYDGPTCPGCKGEKEFLELTKDMRDQRRVLNGLL